ncbi:hypothetical protein BX616_011043 [Lobosporangium transversale]|uniref:Uncharacterized protein n=1 Tax=Lobosporangium transversale TaxID=64571 RepID=A0A1Y2GKE8_9FUNG|nr:hypothetical protein BCR41DRAFT_371571 [Lobosporangium transversale]KAF9909837.1 hypothetical protein BX616_011043 [Lobosporangium transversale]ORZ13456.1 hypothetical protein BCR41DRAFT_371571 [Lobosporangium transversale]|eukprot:XP_021880537.1 hypothetical protein BCR41DRAFT_371571 [Lobosporangium transversale]
MVVPSSSSSLSQQRNFSQQLHSALSPNHLNPHSSNSAYSSYASSISSVPGSRPASPASMNAGITINVPSPPPSPTAYQLKTFVSSAPSTPPVSTVINVGTPNNLTPSSSSSSYFPNVNTAPPQSTSVSLLSLLTQPVTRMVLVLTFIISAVALGGKFPEHCTAPTHVIHSREYLSLLASPFVVPLAPSILIGAQLNLVSSLVLAVSNILSLAIFEDHLTSIFNGDGSRIFRNLFVIIMVLTMAFRQLSGFIFSRSTGWAIPVLFFSDSMYECNLGLAPYLFALLIIQALFPISNEKPTSLWNLRRSHIQLFLCLINVVPKTIVWWAGTGMVVGFFSAMIIWFQRQRGRWGGKVKASAAEKQFWEAEVFENILEDDEAFSDSTLAGESAAPFREKKAGVSCWIALAHVIPTFLIGLLILISSNQIHTFQPDVPNAILNSSIEPQTPYLLTLILMTAPRKQGAAYIKETLTSYLNNFPDEEVDPLYSRIQIVVYTHFSDFPAYDEANAYFDKIPKARKHVKWMREAGFEKNHRLHLLSAIRKIGTMEESVYLGIMEDDFPFCEGGWQEMLNTIYAANRQVQDHCGVFVGTGGSGLIFKRSVALTASFILENDMQVFANGMLPPPPDITLQNCMLGEHDFCSSCAGTIVTSKTLLQRHLGYNSSSSRDGYDEDEFQCGWRQPFNGLPDVHSL